MSTLSKEQVEHVANLARLHLSEQEKEDFAQDMASILGFAEKLHTLDEQLDKLEVDPSHDVLAVKNIFREDQVHESLPVEKVLQNTADQDEDQVKVPSVLEG